MVLDFSYLARMNEKNKHKHLNYSPKVVLPINRPEHPLVLPPGDVIEVGVGGVHGVLLARRPLPQGLKQGVQD